MKRTKNEKNVSKQKKKKKIESWDDDDDTGYDQHELQEIQESILKPEELSTFFKRDVVYKDEKYNIDDRISKRISDIFAHKEDEKGLDKEEKSLRWIKAKKKKEEHFHTDLIDILKPTTEIDLGKQKSSISLMFLEKTHQRELMKMSIYNTFELYFLKTINESKMKTSPSIKHLIDDFQKLKKHPFQISFTHDANQEKKSEKISYIVDLVYDCDIYQFYFLQIQCKIFLDPKTKISPVISSQPYNFVQTSFLPEDDPLRIKIDSLTNAKTKYIQHYYFHCKCVDYKT